MTIREIVESEIPRQVMFYDGEGMCAGILYGEHIICGCCGSIFDVYDIITMAREAHVDGEDIVAIRLFDTWVDLCDDIRGDGSDCGEVLEDTEDY